MHDTKYKETSTSAIIVKVCQASTGKIGILQLNSERTLNSLTLDMVQEIYKHLSNWEDDASLAAVILLGSGDKAFCAGGDIQNLYKSAITTPGGPCDYAESFFLHEYRLNYLLHTYSKPVICFGQGIVMGGGLGLMAGASHRIVTETTRIAMPEITIGLFPDVGGTWFLNKMPDNLGVFFALTGASINASDAMLSRLADFFLPLNSRDSLVEAMLNIDWSHNNEENHSLIENWLEQMSKLSKANEKTKPSQIEPVSELIKRLCQQTSLAEFVSELEVIETDNQWLNKAKTTLSSGSPLSSVLIYEQLMKYRDADLKTVFLSELQLATNIIRYPEFAEGTRALLIDKDNNPNWKFKHFTEVPDALLADFFSAPWPENPLVPYLI